MEYSVRLKIPKYNVRPELREKILKSMSNPENITKIVDALNADINLIQSIVPTSKSESPDSPYEELARVVCGIQTNIVFGKLRGSLITSLPIARWSKYCNSLRALLYEFILCVMTGNKCIDCANEIAELSKKIDILTEYETKIIMKCVNNNTVDINYVIVNE